MVFSTNQVRQLYVVTKVQGTAATLDGKVAESDDAGTIAINQSHDGKHIYFSYKGVDNLMRSDLINIDNIISATSTSATDKSQVRALKQAVVKLDPEVNSGNPISGQDYILRICINPYIGMSDEEPYFKYGAVHAVKGMTTGKFYTVLAASLYKNFSRELGKMLEFSINGKTIGRVKTDVNGGETLIDTTGAAITIESDYSDGVTITEVEQEWSLGLKDGGVVNFTVTPTVVTYNGDDVTWGTVTVSDSSTTINNGKKIADLEYFCMGERGDIYRNVGWPYVIPTKYLADPTKAYNIFNIHYAYVGPGEGPQKSERDLTIVTSDSDAMSKLLGQFNAATGIDLT